jgi:ubiquinol-cytochrome c reductase cytochrome b subunit
MFSAIFIIISLSFLDFSKIRGFQFRPLSKLAFYLFGVIFIGLMFLGAKHVESPFIEFDCTIFISIRK